MLVVSCSQKQKAEQYFAHNELDNLTLQMITYMYTPPLGASFSSKFGQQHKAYYQAQLSSFYLEKLQKISDSTYAFLMIRPVGGSNKRRGILGAMTLDKNNKITDFEEIAATPHLAEELVKERGAFLFQQYVKTGQLEPKYLAMKQYVEWPDNTLIYNKLSHKWQQP
jgi:hypothetical protein